MSYIGIISTFCEVHGPSLIMATVIVQEAVEDLLPKIFKEQEADSSIDCEYCKSFSNVTLPCMVTTEHNSTYLSSRCGGGLYTTRDLKHSCMRCLSCESGTKFVVCDNFLQGGVVCFNFRLPDEKARGGSRLYSLSLMAVGPPKTVISSPSVNDTILPRFEFIANELKERSDINPITGERQDALAFLHLSMIQTMSAYNNEFEELMKYSNSAKNLNLNARISDKLNFDHVKDWLKNGNAFENLLQDFATSGQPIRIKTDDSDLFESLKAFLKYIALPKITLKLEMIQADEEKCPQYELTKDSIVEASVRNSTEIISYVKNLIRTLKMPYNNEVIKAKVDLIIHDYISLLRNWPSKVTSVFLKTKKIRDLDVEWSKKYLAGHFFLDESENEQS